MRRVERGDTTNSARQRLPGRHDMACMAPLPVSMSRFPARTAVKVKLRAIIPGRHPARLHSKPDQCRTSSVLIHTLMARLRCCTLRLFDRRLVFGFRQCLPKVVESYPVLGTELRPQSLFETISFQYLLPALARGVHIGPASSFFARGVDFNPGCGAHHADQCPFATNLPAGNAGALRHMLGARSTWWLFIAFHCNGAPPK